MRLILLAAVLPLAACELDEPATTEPVSEITRPATADSARALDPGAGDVNAPVGGRSTAPGSRPSDAAGTIMVEGEAESIDLRLVEFPGFPLAFETYVPAGWTTDTIAAGEGASAILATSDATPRGIVSVYVPADGSRANALATAREIAQQRGNVRPLDGPEWASETLLFQGDGYAGTVSVGSHSDTAFVLLQEYPVDMGDGFEPRAALVLDRLRWIDDGTAL